MAKNLVLAKAQNAVLAHDWVTAAKLYKELLHGNESNVEYLKELGSIYVKAGEDEKAIPYYEQIITFYPHYIEAMNSLGAIYRRLKRYEESIAILNRALDEDRDTATVNYNLGFTYKEMGNYEAAIEAFESVTSDNPDDVLAYNHLGSIYFIQKDYEKSISSFKRGLQVDPNHPILNYNLARCYEADKNYTDAIRCYETTLKTKPGWTDAIRDFSGLLIKCQDNKKAQMLVEKSIKLHPRDVDLLCILGRIFINQFDYDNATKTYKKANSIDSNNIKVLVGFSEALEKGAKLEEALDKALEAVEIDPYNKDVRKQYIRALLSNQRYEQAYENVVALQEETKDSDLQVLDLFAQYYICRGDELAAKSYHEKIQKINHHYKDHMLSASDRYVQIGDYDKAEEYAKQFVERRTQLPDGYVRLGAIYEAKGDLKSAKLNYEKGKEIREPNIVADNGLKKINEQMTVNPEMYEFETPAIEVNAEEVQTEEQYIPPSFIGEVVGEEKEEQIEEAAADEEEFDYSQLGEEVPMGEALIESEDNFWEDFDDDPNAEPKDLADEESDVENNESADEGFDDDIFDKLGGSDPDAEEGALDDEFVFPPANNVPVEEELPQSVPVESDVEEPSPSMAIEPELPDSSAARIMPQSQPVQTHYDPSIMSAGTQLQPGMTASHVERAMDAAFMAQRMVQNLAEQQKRFEENIELKNEKMIHEEVEKVVDQKIQKSMDTQMERIMMETEDTLPHDEMDDFLSTDDFIEVEEAAPEEAFFSTVDDLMGEEAEPIDISAISDLPEDDVFADVMDFACEEEPATEEAVVGEVEEEAVDVVESSEVPEAVEDDFAEVTDFACEEPAAEEAVVETVENTVEEEAVDVVETVEAPETEEDFADVTDFACEESTAEEVVVGAVDVVETVEAFEAAEEDFADVTDFACEEPAAEETVVEAVENTVEEEAVDAVETVEAPETAEEDAAIETLQEAPAFCLTPIVPEGQNNELELFKTLRVLSNFLPENEKDSFLSCRIRMMIEYIIAKMSGRKGLLITAETLIKSGALGEEYENQLSNVSEDDLSNDMISHVLKYMKKLAANLEDERLAKALCVSADNILEQIELANQPSQIF